MRTGHIALWLGLLALGACATPLPAPVRATDVRALAGNYWGSMDEASQVTRPVKTTIDVNGRFEITVGAPDGFRTVGLITVEPDGSLRYRYDDVEGTGTVYEGNGRRVIVLRQQDGSTTTQVEQRFRE